MSVRVRFAPSPTGFLHIGSLRTVLFNYLIVKALEGTFILRIEDTDQKREVAGSAEKLEEILNWLNIHFDEGPLSGGAYGPYVQSQRRAIYDRYAEEILKGGHAYRCFCSSEEIAKMKEDALLGKTLKDKVKEVCGTCQSMGILVEGKPAHDTIVAINEGKFDAQIKSGKTELTAEEKKHLEEEKKKLTEEMAARRVEFEKQAKQLMELYKDKEATFIRKKLREAKIPETLIKELLPEEKKAAGPGA